MNEKLITADCKQKSIIKDDGESHNRSMDFPFLHAKKLGETSDAMIEEDVIEQVAQLRKTLKSHILYEDSEYFAAKKEFYCGYCDRRMNSASGLAMVDHVLSNGHISTVYSKGLVFCAADHKKLVRICRKLSKSAVAPRGKTPRSRPRPDPVADFLFPRVVLSDHVKEPNQAFNELDDFSKHFHLSTLYIDFPFTRGTLKSQVIDPMQGFDELDNFSKILTDDSLTSVVKYSFPYQERIHCYYCNTVFEPPHGAIFMRHLISPSHLSKVIRNDRVFSVSGDLDRFKRMYHGSSVLRRFEKS